MREGAPPLTRAMVEKVYQRRFSELSLRRRRLDLAQLSGEAPAKVSGPLLKAAAEKVAER
jgi:hypothetical protein